MKEIVKAIGINPERIKMTFCSSAEGAKFQKIATEFDKLIRELGPSPLRTKSGTPEKAKAKAEA